MSVTWFQVEIMYSTVGWLFREVKVLEQSSCNRSVKSCEIYWLLLVNKNKTLFKKCFHISVFIKESS